MTSFGTLLATSSKAIANLIIQYSIAGFIGYKGLIKQSDMQAFGAVMNVLRERGPLKTEELFAALKENHPGAAAQVEKSGVHLITTSGGHQLHKRKGGASPATIGLENICDYPLRNQLMKIRSRPTSERKLSGYAGKANWYRDRDAPSEPQQQQQGGGDNLNAAAAQI